MILAEVGLGELLWSLLIIFFMVMYFMIMFQVIFDVFRSDSSGWVKAGWLIVMLFVPVLTLLVYLIKNGDQMRDRQLAGIKAQQAYTDDYIRSVAGGPTAEIEKAKALLDQGVLTQAEFDSIKARALAA